MKNTSLAILNIILVTALTFSSAYAKKIWPAEILARELDYPGFGWLGHVAIATTANMTDPSAMEQDADLVIEILNDVPVGQINSISNFKSRSHYWGSKYGVADRGKVGYKVILEANQQHWWCPKYTYDTRYHVGSGSGFTGQINECGTWRCDTYAWWAFYSQGLNTMPGYIWLPRIMFNYFPYYNDNEEELVAKSFDLPSLKTNRTLENVTADELNEMSPEEFQMIMDAPPTHYVTSPSAIQIQLANDSNLNEVKRGIMIDRLIADDLESDLIKKLLKLYNETDSNEVKDKIVQDLMLYDQQHRNVQFYITNEQPLLKFFFDQLLDAKSLSSKSADDGTRGFIDTHSPDEIMANLSKINKALLATDHYSSIMLKYTLVYKSRALEAIYIKSIVDELRKANNSELDSYLFGPLALGFQGSGKNLLESESKQLVTAYLKEVQYKYTSKGIKANPDDFHRGTTAAYYFELIKNMD